MHLMFMLLHTHNWDLSTIPETLYVQSVEGKLGGPWAKIRKIRKGGTSTWEATSGWISQKIALLLFDQKIHYLIHKNLPWLLHYAR